MATANSTRHSVGSSLSAQTDEFAALQHRLLVAINQVMLVNQHFGDLAGLNPDDVPAGLVLCQAAKDLDQVYDDIDSWEVRHTHSPKPKTTVGVGVFTDDTAARSRLPDLPPALPCPFCGRIDDIKVSETDESVSEHGKWYEVSCGSCAAQAGGGSTALEAVQGWNTRDHLASPRAIFNAVEDQRSKLLNVLGAVQCIKLATARCHGVDNPVAELEGAIHLLEDEVQRIVTGLDERSLLKAISGIGEGQS